MTTLLWVTAVLLVLGGIAGTIFPLLPGSPLIFLGLLLAAWINDFQEVGTWTLVTLGVLTAFSLSIDFIASAVGAKRLGASKLAVLGATLGSVVGIFFGIPGLILGPFVGAALGEAKVSGDLIKAGKVGVGSSLGFILGIAAKLTVVFLMLGIFVGSYIL